jgi:GT2 family glycosyltransferase
MNNKRKKYNPRIAVIIPIEEKTDLLNATLASYRKQTYDNYHIYLSSTKPFKIQDKKVTVYSNIKHKGEVALKRNLALRLREADILVFNDDDVIVPSNYLKKIVQKLRQEKIHAVCGPLLTPKNSSLMEAGSGAVWESYMGSIGAGIYRSRKMDDRLVYDYPAANLIIRSKIFRNLGGFEKGIYPGEDTKLCLDLYHKYDTGVHYFSELYVYHKRKALFKAHLAQIGRYGKQRGKFSISYPKTSFKLTYFLPSILTVYGITVFLYLFISGPVYNPYILFALTVPVIIYGVLIFSESVIIVCTKGFKIGVLAFFGIIATHVYYGFNFIKGFIYKTIHNRIIKT